jgi:hypothetical protein
MPCSSVEMPQQFGGTYRFHLQGPRVSQGSGKQSLQTGAIRPSEMLVDMYQIIRHQNPDDCALQLSIWENLKSNKDRGCLGTGSSGNLLGPEKSVTTEHETNHELPTNSGIKHTWSYTSTPHTPSWICLLPASCWCLAWLTIQPWRWRRHVLPKRRLTFNRLHGATSQNNSSSTFYYYYYYYYYYWCYICLSKPRNVFARLNTRICFCCLELCYNYGLPINLSAYKENLQPFATIDFYNLLEKLNLLALHMLNVAPLPSCSCSEHP